MVVQVVPRTRGIVAVALTAALSLGVGGLGWLLLERAEVQAVRSPIPTQGLPHKGASPREARVTMVVCSEFQCPFCERARHSVETLLVDNPDLAFYFTHLPLRMHEYAELRARAALAAQRQGRFWAMHDAIFDGEVVDEASAVALAQGLGMDTLKFTDDLRDPETAAEVQRQSRTCTDLGVRAVPTFFINGREVRGALPTAELQRIIDEVRE